MEIYRSSFLTIEKQDDTLLQTWNDKKFSPEDFQQELRLFRSLYEKVNPKHVLWDNSKFSLDIPPTLFSWIENDILMPLHDEHGLTSLQFVVSNDAMAQISVMKSLENVKEKLQSFYFTTKEDAINYLNTPKKKYYVNESTIPSESERARIVIDTTYENIDDTIQAIKSIKKYKTFQNDNKFKFNCLTVREREVFQLVVHGNTAKEIALQLHIEYATVTTHKKNIIKKLELRSFYDWYAYAKAFGVLWF